MARKVKPTTVPLVPDKSVPIAPLNEWSLSSSKEFSVVESQCMMLYDNSLVFIVRVRPGKKECK